MKYSSVSLWRWKGISIGLVTLSFGLLGGASLKAEDCVQELSENLKVLQLSSACEKSPDKCPQYVGLSGPSGPLLTVAILKVLLRWNNESPPLEPPRLPEPPTTPPTSKNKILQRYFQPLDELYSKGHSPPGEEEKNCKMHLKNSRKALDWIFQKSNLRQLDCSNEKMSFSPLHGPRIEVDLALFSRAPFVFPNQGNRPELSLLITEAAACCVRSKNPQSPITAPSSDHCARHFWDPGAKSPLISASRGPGTKSAPSLSSSNEGRK